MSAWCHSAARCAEPLRRAGTGRGGASIWGGKFPDELRDTLKARACVAQWRQRVAACVLAADGNPRRAQHSARGILSMANSGPNTNASQFFITYAKHAHLNGKYTVFGRVIGGLEVLDAMEKVCFRACVGFAKRADGLCARQAPCDANDAPLSDIRLKGVTMHANPLAQ